MLSVPDPAGPAICWLRRPDPSMDKPAVPHPFVWMVLYFPLGMVNGFPAVALGYLGSRAGLDVSAVAAIVGMTFIGGGWKFLWAPVGDYTLSRKSWYLIAMAGIAVGLIAMTAIPLTKSTAPILSALTLFTTVSATFSA